MDITHLKEGEISISVIVTDPQHIKAMLAMKRMARVAVLKQVCPPADSGVMDIINQGWSLWVAMKSDEELLTGGTCHY